MFKKFCMVRRKWNTFRSIEEVNTSPMRPMACESEATMLIAPISCNISSAAIVSALILDSAKATSSGMSLSRWWQTICKHWKCEMWCKHTECCINTRINISYQHIKMLIYSIAGERSCGVRWWGQDIFHTTYFDDIWSMTPTCTFTAKRNQASKSNIIYTIYDRTCKQSE